ncbi:hypothetical protein GCM10009094_19490 [Massilia aurea]|jgi:hypothetical protein
MQEFRSLFKTIKFDEIDRIWQRLFEKKIIIDFMLKVVKVLLHKWTRAAVSFVEQIRRRPS